MGGSYRSSRQRGIISFLERYGAGRRLRLRSSVEHVAGADRQVAKTTAARREDRVADRRRDDRGGWLAQTRRRLGALDEGDVEGGHVADAKGRIAVQVG